MTRERSPEHSRPQAERTGAGKKTRRVSHRKELAVVTLGMVAAISGVGGLLATNPPSWATTTDPVRAITVPKATVHHEPVRQATERKERATRGVEEQDAVRRAPQESAGQKDAARKAEARAKIARRESRRVARQRAVYSAQPQASATASAAASTASASAVSQGS